MKKEQVNLKTAQKRLLNLMQEKKLSHKDVAQMAGVETESVTKFLKDSARIISMSAMTKIFKLLELKYHEDLLDQKKSTQKKISDEKKKANQRKLEARRRVEDAIEDKQLRDYYDF